MRAVGEILVQTLQSRHLEADRSTVGSKHRWFSLEGAPAPGVQAGVLDSRKPEPVPLVDGRARLGRARVQRDEGISAVERAEIIQLLLPGGSAEELAIDQGPGQ